MPFMACISPAEKTARKPRVKKRSAPALKGKAMLHYPFNQTFKPNKARSIIDLVLLSLKYDFFFPFYGNQTVLINS